MPTETLTCIMIAAACIFAVASILYGVFKKFTQMSWMSYQLLLVFLVVALLRFLPADIAPAARFFIGLLTVAGATVVFVGGGGLLRLAMLKKRLPAHGAWRFLNRLLGGITALWDYIMIVLVVGAPVLSFFAFVYNPLPGVLGPFFELGIWKDFLAHHALDFVLVAIFVFAMRGGWRVGLARFSVIVLMIALSFGSVALAVYLAVFVPFFSDMAGGMAAGMSISPAVAHIISAAIVALVLFILFFAVVCVLGFFMTKLIRRIRYDYFWGTVDGVVGCVLALIVAALIVAGIYAGFAAVSGGALSAAIEGLLSQLGENAAGVTGSLQPIVDGLKSFENMLQGYAGWLQSAPLSAAFYFNPLSVG